MQSVSMSQSKIFFSASSHTLRLGRCVSRGLMAAHRLSERKKATLVQQTLFTRVSNRLAKKTLHSFSISDWHFTYSHSRTADFTVKSKHQHGATWQFFFLPFKACGLFSRKNKQIDELPRKVSQQQTNKTFLFFLPLSASDSHQKSVYIKRTETLTKSK